MRLNLDPNDSSIPVSDWLAARAKNATRRRALIGAMSGAVFVATLVALVLAPQRRHRIPAADLVPPVQLDTLAVIAAATSARARFVAADSALGLIRVRTAQAQARTAADTLNPAMAARRDSLSATLDGLQGLLDKVVTSPLPSSYHALAANAALSGNRRIALLVDSLDEIEQERDTLGTSGTTDPVFIALTSRITDLGRSIEEVAEARRDDLRSTIDALGTPRARSVMAETPDLDTIPWVAERDSAESAIALATGELAIDRDSLATNARDIEAQRREADQFVSPLDMLGAALVVGLVLGFGAALVAEFMRPRIADAREVERLTRLRVVATVRPVPSNPDRARRSVDHSAPPFIDSLTDAYQLTYLYLSRDESKPLLLALTGDEAPIVAVTAANLAALSATEANSVLLIDTDTSRASVAATLRIRAEPGFADIAGGGPRWTDLRTRAQVGRDRSIDVIPSGIGVQPPAELIAAFVRDNRDALAKDYDAILIVVPMDRVGDEARAPMAAWAPDTLICARVGHTLVGTLIQQIDSLRRAGASPVGILLWNAPLPSLPTPREIRGAQRPLHTQEMQAITTRR